ncbi:MAG: hypothetical protein EOO99_06365 [Pedobacter sp.]|nr:MAG: hypothetical protein EOO99_06365 [Pedobacter sp.]
MKIKTIEAANRESILNQVDLLSNQLFSNALCIGDSAYQLTEIEFYLRTKDDSIFNDPYTYGHDLQLESYKLYAHASGLDITFGNENFYVGVLIRGVAKFRDKYSFKTELEPKQHYNLEKIISGPQKVATELISNLAFDQQNYLYFSPLFYATAGPYPFVHIAKTIRHGLSKKEEYYHDLPLRHIGFFPIDVIKNINDNKNITISNRTQIIIDNYRNNRIQNLDIVKLILGYIPSELR